MDRLIIFVAQLTNPFPKVAADNHTIENILGFVLTTLGAVALLIMVIGGFKFVISSGDPQGTTEARETIIFAAVGLAVVIFAYTIVSWVAGQLVI